MRNGNGGKAKKRLTGEAKTRRLSTAELEKAEAERKQAEEALQAEKNKLQSVVDALEYGLTIHDADYNILYQNELLRTIFGDHLGEKCYQVYESKDNLCDGCPVEKAFKNGKSHTSERRVILPSGEVTFWENTANPVRDASGRIVSCLEVTRDITGRKQAEEALQAEKDKLQSVIDALGYGLNIQDKDYNIIYQNEMARIMSGGNHVGEKCYRAFEGRNEICDGCPLSKAFKDGKSHTTERKLVSSSGEVVYWENIASPVRDARGKIVSGLEVVRDITERKRMEEVLRASEEALRKMFESVTDGIWVIDLHGVITKVNDRALEMHGFSSKDALVGKNALELIAPSDQGRAKANMRKVLKEGAVKDVEYTLLRADGSEFPGELSTSALRDADGNCIGHITVSRDITERKQVEEELRLRAKMLDSATDSIFVHDLDGNLIYVNEAACRVHGYSREEFMKMKVTQITSPRSGGDVSGVDQQMRKKGELTFEAVHLCKDGSVIPMDIHCRLVESGGEKLILAVARDITERKRVEEELKLRAQLLDSATDSIFVHDLDENFIYVNEAACRVLGYSREEFMKMKVSQIFPPDQVGSLAALRQKTLGKGELVFETAHLRKDGSLIPVEVHNRTIESGGRKLILAVTRDITERKRAEQEKNDVEQKAHLASRLASVGEMASGIAHEINNPLTAVIGFAQLLMDADLPDDTREDMAIIYKEAQRAAGVARNLLTFARKHAPSKQPTNLNNIIEGVLKLRAYEQNVSNIQINNHLAPDLPEVMADYSHLQQVFINLILNAEAAMLEANNGGILTVTTQRVNDIVRTSFADNGPGISEENMKRIFDPFFTTKEVGKGTGLGLSVCHGIVTEHGGKIYAKSKQGSGATFIVELPISS